MLMFSVFKKFLIGGQHYSQDLQLVAPIQNKSYYSVANVFLKDHLAGKWSAFASLFSQDLAIKLFDLFAYYLDNVWNLDELIGKWVHYIPRKCYIFPIPFAWVFGISIVSSFEPQQQQYLLLTEWREAQRALIYLPKHDIKLWIVNVHLHDPSHHSNIRESQAQELCRWMNDSIVKDSNAHGIIITGDFNASPEETTYQVMVVHGYSSAYKQVNGKEPNKTWPSGIEGVTIDIDGTSSCLDYIWYKGSRLVCSSCSLAADAPLNNDPTLYPSDHYGIVAEFDFLPEST